MIAMKYVENTIVSLHICIYYLYSTDCVIRTLVAKYFNKIQDRQEEEGRVEPPRHCVTVHNTVITLLSTPALPSPTDYSCDPQEERSKYRQQTRRIYVSSSSR